MGMVPVGVSGFNWLRAQQLRAVTNNSGLQLTQLKTSDPSGICGRQLDMSVTVGGVGHVPINSDTITPDLVQGHAFIAPMFVDTFNHGNLIQNPTAQFGFNSWFTVEAGVTGQTHYTIDNSTGTQYDEFVITYNGGSHVDSLICQPVDGLIPGSVMTFSGLVGVRAVTNEGGSTAIGSDILSLDANNGGIAVIAQDYGHLAVSGPTFFSYQFTVPASGNVQIRLHVRNASGSTQPISASYSQLKLEYGNVPTAFGIKGFTPETEVDITGVVHSILVGTTFTNIPMNATKILWLFRKTGQTDWVSYAETSIPGLPYPPQIQYLTFAYGQLSLGIDYDFGAAYVDLRGNTGAIGIIAGDFNPNSSIFQINSSYMKTFGGSFTPSFPSTPTLSTPLSANGISSSVQMDFTINNQPTDGSLSRVSVWYRVAPGVGVPTDPVTSPYTFYASVPAVGVGLALSSLPSSGTYEFIFTDLSNGTHYDFAVSCEDASGGETPIVYANSMVAQELVLPTTAAPTHPANMYIQAQATSTQVGPTGQSAYYSQLQVTINLHDGGPNGATLDPSAWLAQIRFLAKPISSTTTGDFDLNANDYTICNTIYTNTITSPITVTIGPFPANTNQEIAVQLVDQAGKISNADPFLIALPPNQPVFDSLGRLQYVSFGNALTEVITPQGTLQNQVVSRINVASPALGANLLFNPTGFYGTKFWTNGYGSATVPSFQSQPFAGGRFNMYALPTTAGSVDYVQVQTLSNLQSGIDMVMSGLIEIDTLVSGKGAFAGVDIYDPVSGATIAQYLLHDNANKFTPTYFEYSFKIPSSGAIQIRMHIYNGGSTDGINAYFYKLQLEHGTLASPFQDSMAQAAAANVTAADGTMIVVSNNVSGGTIDYNASPQAIKTAVTSTGNVDAGRVGSINGSTVPWDASNGAYQIATGTNGQITNGNFLTLSLPTGVTSYRPATNQSTLIIPFQTGGTYQVMVHITAFTNAGRISVTAWRVDLQSFTSIAGYTGAINMDTQSPSITGANPLSASFFCSGGQRITIQTNFSSSSTLTQAATMTIQCFRVS